MASHANRDWGAEAQRKSPGEKLFDNHSFVLCDARVSGFPIRHASDGFKDMFRYSDGESPSRSEKLDACSSIMDSEAAVAAVADAAALSTPDVLKALQLLEDVAAGVCQQSALGEHSGKADSVLLVKEKGGGEIFVCLLGVILLRHPSTGWTFLVGLHQDITQQLSLPDLLQAATLGTLPVRQLLAGLRMQTGRQDALLEDPASTSHLYEAFDKVWRVFLSGLKSSSSPTGCGPGSMLQRGACGGAGGGSGRGSPGVGTKHHSDLWGKKQKTARSEVSAATTASHVSVARKRTPTSSSPNKTGSEATASAPNLESVPSSECNGDELPESPPLSIHLLELLEPTCGELQLPASPARAEQKTVVGHCLVHDDQLSISDASDVSDVASKKELRDLDFPVAIFDPSQPGLPAILCSVGLANLLDCPAPEGKIEGIAIHEIFDQAEEAEECMALCEAAVRGEYYSSSVCAAGLAKLGGGPSQRLAEGELVSAEGSLKRSGEAGTPDSMVFLKQLELDDRMYIVCIQADIPESGGDDLTCHPKAQLLFAGEGIGYPIEDRRWLAYMCLDEHMDTLLQALASNFWLSAPMRRQTVCLEEDLP